MQFGSFAGITSPVLFSLVMYICGIHGNIQLIFYRRLESSYQKKRLRFSWTSWTGMEMGKSITSKDSLQKLLIIHDWRLLWSRFRLIVTKTFSQLVPTPLFLFKQYVSNYMFSYHYATGENINFQNHLVKYNAILRTIKQFPPYLMSFCTCVACAFIKNLKIKTFSRLANFHFKVPCMSFHFEKNTTFLDFQEEMYCIIRLYN